MASPAVVRRAAPLVVLLVTLASANIAPFFIGRPVPGVSQFRSYSTGGVAQQVMGTPDSDDSSGPPCVREGFFPNPSNSSRFYRCVNHAETGQYFSRYEFTCPHGLMFVQEDVNTCLIGDSAVSSTNEPMPPTGGTAAENGMVHNPVVDGQPIPIEFLPDPMPLPVVQPYPVPQPIVPAPIIVPMEPQPEVGPMEPQPAVVSVGSQGGGTGAGQGGGGSYPQPGGGTGAGQVGGGSYPQSGGGAGAGQGEGGSYPQPGGGTGAGQDGGGSYPQSGGGAAAGQDGGGSYPQSGGGAGTGQDGVGSYPQSDGCAARYVQVVMYCNMYVPCPADAKRYICTTGSVFVQAKQMCLFPTQEEEDPCAGKSIAVPQAFRSPLHALSAIQAGGPLSNSYLLGNSYQFGNSYQVAPQVLQQTPSFQQLFNSGPAAAPVLYHHY